MWNDLLLEKKGRFQSHESPLRPLHRDSEPWEPRPPRLASRARNGVSSRRLVSLCPFGGPWAGVTTSQNRGSHGHGSRFPAPLFQTALRRQRRGRSCSWAPAPPPTRARAHTAWSRGPSLASGPQDNRTAVLLRRGTQGCQGWGRGGCWRLVREKTLTRLPPAPCPGTAAAEANAPTLWLWLFPSELADGAPM